MCPEDHKIFVFGGFEMSTSDELFNSIITIDTKTWRTNIVTNSKGTIPSGRHGHTATYWKDGKLIVFGGENDRGQYPNEVYIYDLRNNEWSCPEVRGLLPEGRSRHSACLSECTNRLYFSGGHQGQLVFDDIFCLDLETWTWSDRKQCVARYDHATTVFDDKIWVFGGLTEEMDRPSETLWFDLRNSAVATIKFETEVDDDSQDSIGASSRRGSPTTDMGTHFYAFCGSVVVHFATHGHAILNTDTSISSFELRDLRWRTLADGSNDIFSGYVWSYIALSGTTAYLLGFQRGNEGEELGCLSSVLPIELKYYGIVPKQKSTNSLELEPESLNADMQALFNDKESSDFIITAVPDDYESENEVQDEDAHSPAVSEPIFVHSLVLLARWPHFRRLANSRMREFHRKKMHIPETHSTVKALVQYLYSDTIDNSVSISVISKVLVLSNMYALPRLRDICVARIQDGFNYHNAVIIWECAKIAQEEVLRVSAARFCFKHWGRVVRTKAFQKLSKNAMLELCAEVDERGHVVSEWNFDLQRSRSRSGLASVVAARNGGSRRSARAESVMIVDSESESD
ncbi:hypothetical protein V1514DRAFT_284491 [Lipomyces japonicus]|uniref:uncharacterized protein n=1 Tax=Lipomyces japonicus TaxID=56871 RepID=UPI0034CF3DB2